MTADVLLTADPRAELGGPEVRRVTRRATAARAGVTLWTRLQEVWGTLASVGVGVAVLGGSLASLRERISVSGAPVTEATLPASAAAVVVGVLALAGLGVLLDRLGPVSSTPAAAAWWLPLPADRRGLLRGELVRITAVVAAVATVLTLPVALGLPAEPTPVSVLTGLGWAASLAAAAVGGTALLQTRGRGGRLAPVAGSAVVAVAVLAAAAGTAAAVGHVPLAVPRPGAPPAWLVALPAAAAVVLLLTAERGLGRLDAGRLRAGGATVQYAGASVLSLDTRDLGRALSGRPRPPRRSRRFGWVRRPEQAVVAADLAVLARGRWPAGQLVVAVALPVVVARTAGLGALPLAVWCACLLGWALAAAAAGRPGREAQAAPVLDRLLPLSAARVVLARACVPLLLTTAVCGLTGLLLGIGTGRAVDWAALGLATAPVWAAGALRAAYRPDPDWAGPVVSTPMGILPAGVGATLVQGVDLGVVGSLPLLLALLHGEPAAVLVAVQLGWSFALAVGALVHLARREAPS
ncbi:hypothetical protein DQ238_15210 [Geodermatophilus sp. TF02-6]|uniref:DUF6297 family protein n=1 Tax=Geodermatophilus sp. TF02-6 TaxID=2250575 RepID=UPI000DE97921|nr:DUF6297 family protein [Geodermatophilus sp. TF02-6]RBY77243.1 hypothetical protein DQ238_15210 [Geodermatophilus sp. TF02-6]